MEFLFAGLGLLGLLVVFGVFLPMAFRRVTEANEVHIVQTGSETKSYGKDSGNGNTYYEWPSWIPGLGVTKTILPVSVFDLELKNYEAYDKGRLPFVIDVTAFFRITDSNQAARSVSNFQELKTQLESIVKGSVRTILANHDIEEIMQGRSAFGESFTKEVSDQLKNWGVGTVKNIELMDIRDSGGNNVIGNIMEKKKSLIEMESRQEVAANRQRALESEIEAKRKVDVRQQDAAREVGLKTVETQQQVSLAQQEMEQQVKERQKLTKEKEMAVLQVEHVRTAEINKQTQIIKAEQDKQAAIIKAEAALDVQTKDAEAKLILKLKEAEGLTAEGTAKAQAEKAMQLAPVEAQIVLAKEIGQNESYQKYLVTIKQVEAQQYVGIEQAKALKEADIKIIANSGDASSGLNNVMDVFSSKGRTQLGAMLEGFANTDAGKALVDKFTGSGNTTVQ